MNPTTLFLGIVSIILLNSNFTPTLGLIGYDCGGATTNITTLSLLEVGECDIPHQEVNVSKKYIQLLQINQYSSIHVIQCKVEIYRQIRRCGMHSHTMDVLNGEYSYIESVTMDECKRMHNTGRTKIGRTEISGIHRNMTTSRPVVIAGDIGPDGSCQGVYYSDPYGTWASVIVKGTVKISLRDYTATVNVDANKVQMLSGTSCELNEGQCIDIDGGNTFWNPLPEDSCKSNRYGLLYEGYADQTEDIHSNFKQTVYSMTEGEIIFALTSKDRTNVCGYTLIRTEHPKLIIVEIERGNPFIRKELIAVNNLDIFAYVNSKFVYVEKHIRTQMKQMYRDILIQRCNLERQVLQNALTLARKSPDEFAFNIMKGPGYMALMAGEVAHIIKCIPVDVKVAETKECYDQLPVFVSNNSYYLAPRTHILTKMGIQITCNRLVSPMYLLDGAWYSTSPTPVLTMPPNIIKPLTAPTWRYHNLNLLATSGIYTQKDLDELRNHIMFPAERPAILNSVARGIVGEPTIAQGGPLSNLLDDETIHKIIESTWEKTWGYFSVFGNISAGFIGIIIMFRGIKLIFDTIIHGYALHTVYGWSIYLVGAVWDSVTNLLLHLSKRPPSDKGINGTGAEAQKLINNPQISEKPDAEEISKGTTDNNPFSEINFGFDQRIHKLTEFNRATTSTGSYDAPTAPTPVTQGEPLYGRPTKPSFNRPLSFVWAINKSDINTDEGSIPLPEKRRLRKSAYISQTKDIAEGDEKIYPDLRDSFPPRTDKRMEAEV